MLLSAFAPAKINLFLHIHKRRTDGYHALESLVAFADIGDRLTLDLNEFLSLKVSGAYAKECGATKNNLVLKAAEALQILRPQLQAGTFRLEKNLPIAAGLGGGSADAAAALGLLANANQISEDDPLLYEAARKIGADVPVCLKSKSALIRGAGEDISFVELPPLPTVLVNCKKQVLTRDVFAKLKLQENRQPSDFKNALQTFDDVILFLQEKNNDLANPARSLCPEIAKAEQALKKTDAALVRLSGSGATVFGLYKDKSQANHAAHQLQENHPHWWVKASMLG
jgi:4-diphosphocytidyl-2-C-methyl-D-erythritol kinase